MYYTEVVQKLEDNAVVFQALFNNISPVHANWKSLPEKWSLLEIINHLLDEEVFDFRQRIEFALNEPAAEWTRITPVKWVTEKDYINKNFSESLNNFLAERQKSVQWLKGLSSPDWNATDNYPYGKALTAGESLANWLAHDYLHIRQINRLNWDYLKSIAPAVDLDYAGNW